MFFILLYKILIEIEDCFNDKKYKELGKGELAYRRNERGREECSPDK